MVLIAPDIAPLPARRNPTSPMLLQEAHKAENDFKISD